MRDEPNKTTITEYVTKERPEVPGGEWMTRAQRAAALAAWDCKACNCDQCRQLRSALRKGELNE